MHEKDATPLHIQQLQVVRLHLRKAVEHALVAVYSRGKKKEKFVCVQWKVSFFFSFNWSSWFSFSVFCFSVLYVFPCPTKNMTRERVDRRELHEQCIGKATRSSQPRFLAHEAFGVTKWVPKCTHGLKQQQWWHLLHVKVLSNGHVELSELWYHRPVKSEFRLGPRGYERSDWSIPTARAQLQAWHAHQAGRSSRNSWNCAAIQVKIVSHAISKKVSTDFRGVQVGLILKRARGM